MPHYSIGMPSGPRSSAPTRCLNFEELRIAPLQTRAVSSASRSRHFTRVKLSISLIADLATEEG
jgi:hypothetical protein